MKLLPALLPQISHASVAGLVGGAVRLVHWWKVARSSADIGNENKAFKNTTHARQLAKSLNQGRKSFGSMTARRIVVVLMSRSAKQ
jgi:hypothetical protein